MIANEEGKEPWCGFVESVLAERVFIQLNWRLERVDPAVHELPLWRCVNVVHFNNAADMVTRTLSLLVFLLGFSSIASLTANARADFARGDDAIIAKKWPQAQTSWTGLKYIILKKGKGPVPQTGDLVSVLYKGSFLNGKIFDEDMNPKKPFKFRLGRGLVIPAWEEALAHMKKGEKRLIIVPYSLGYGFFGKPPVIPPKATLVFEIDLLGFVHDE